VARRFQEAGANLCIVGFPDEIDGAISSKPQKSWVYEGVEVCELRRGPLEDFLIRLVPMLKKRRATFPLACLFFKWAYAKQISRLCQGSQVFHYFGTGTEMNGYAVAKAARSLGAKFFVEPAVHEGTWGDSWLDVPLYQTADLLIAHTGYEARLLENLGVPKEKIQTIVHGVDFCDSGDGARFRKKHQISGPMVLFLGRKTKEKGVERLLSAWPMVVGKFPEATLVFAGPKSDAFGQMADGGWRMLEEKAKAESGNPEKLKGLDAGCWTLDSALRARVLNLDDLAEEEKQDALAACDVLCVPSEGESFGMVYYEAWAYRKPIVALDLPVLRESIGRVEGGLLASTRADSISNSLIRVLGDTDLCARLGDNGYRLAKKHRWPHAIESYHKVYQSRGI